MTERDPFKQPTSSIMPDYGSTTGVPNVVFADFSPTELFSLSENIATNISSTNSGLKSLEKMLKQIGGQHDNQLFRDKIHNVMQTVNSSINITTRDLQRLSVVVRRGDKLQKLQLERLMAAFKDALGKYTQVRQQVNEKMLAHIPLPIKRHRDQTNVDITTADDDDQAQLMANQQSQARLLEFETSMLLDREAQISRIEADVIDVNQIMADLAEMVNAQGQTIDSVESQIENAASNVDSATDELAKAAQYKNQYRRKMLILLAIALVIAIILIVIIVRTVK